MTTVKNARAKVDCIKNPSKYDEDKQGCLICLEPAASPMRCKVCRTIFCKACALKWFDQNRKCPKKCSEKWDLEDVPSIEVRLCCPVSKKCPIVLNPDNFEQHILKCRHNKLTPIDGPYDPKYLCLDRHPLTFISIFQDNKKHYTKCTGCLQQLICRSNCQFCEIEQKPSYYCAECRIPPGITSRRCPLDHQLKIIKEGVIICDLCSRNAIRFGNLYCFHDESCNLTVCLQCQKKLPIRRKSII